MHSRPLPQLDGTFRAPDEKTGADLGMRLQEFGGESYQLTDGRVFLMKWDNDTLMGKQLNKDLVRIDLPSASIVEIGMAEPEIKGFFAR